MGFKQKGVNWEEVTAAGSSALLPAGGYVAVITDVEDVERSEYLRLTYDIAEGPCKGFFATDDRDYTHQFTRSYTDKASGFMKRFLQCVEDSNAGFSLASWDSDPQGLKGKLVGILVQREDYTNRSGEDRARMNVEGFASADDIRAGRFVLPEPKDTRDKADKPAASVYGADIPF